ncbi:helix-turn-helix transcriptional regulator [Flavobacterium amniphilum]|uniref:helix-turn-helix domain-containing protein n=1 Tax=Flavobacterium amniphilum TaxID=1834035 RepID=UPI002029FBB5|nr:helix-turn-helix transcriptional regulator [Flavobacterium amniphilum]MCL9804457.1 helix-turn-helix transcriptional regulator [Flavobacterium amniphilum]
MGRINKKQNQRTALGLTQEELAIILKVPISRIAMYETGKRDLPAQAGLSLTYMSIHLLEKQKQEFVHPGLKEENSKIIEFLEDELRKNERSQHKYRKMIEDIREKYEKGIANLYLSEYFAAKETNDDRPSDKHADYLHLIAKQKISENGPAAQKKAMLQLETLKWQHSHLKGELKKYLVISP